MAKDLILRESNRTWSRGVALSGEEFQAEAPRSRSATIVWWALGATVATRVLTGEWPWYWLDGMITRR